MGVYIKGMETPKSCGECLNIGWNYVFECNLDDVENGERRIDCPLVPVPPHGDLIDKDATMNAILEERGEDTACWFAGIVNDMPAIIPAEEGE